MQVLKRLHLGETRSCHLATPDVVVEHAKRVNGIDYHAPTSTQRSQREHQPLKAGYTPPIRYLTRLSIR